MVELILAGVIITAVCAVAVVTAVHDRRRSRAEQLAAEADREPGGEPIPGGWPGRSTLGRRSPTP